ncbi:MAG: Minf_1886 family protein [Victivallaceae bacterium]
MKNNDLADKIRRLLQKETRYQADAYEFISAAVTYAVGLSDSNEKKHISALDLLKAIRDFAVLQYGPFSAEVLKNWGVNSASDVGNIVFHLIDEKALYASENDSREDFNTNFDLFKPAQDAANGTRSNIKVPKIV